MLLRKAGLALLAALCVCAPAMAEREGETAASGDVAPATESPSGVAASDLLPEDGVPLMPAKRPIMRGPDEDGTITIVLVGDTGLGGDRQPVDARGAYRHGARIAWADLTTHVRDLIDGDLNFANLESVVTDRNDLKSEDKTYVFRSHPDGVRHLAAIGFNLLSTANNHSMDYGARGLQDTLTHLDAITSIGLIKAHAGLGRDRADAGRPRIVDVKGARVALSAIGIVSGGFPHHRAGPNRGGQLAIQSPEDFDDVTRWLGEAAADYRMLSVHHGQELAVRPGSDSIRKLRQIAVRERGIDLVVGHHAHVVAGVEMVQGHLIFYGLGNFMHPGMQNMARFGMCRDYGLLARVHLMKGSDGRLAARAVEVVPVTDMHAQVRRFAAAQSAERVEVLNYLARALDDPQSGAVGVRFAPQQDGSGLYCAPGAATDVGRIGRLCANWREPLPPTAAMTARIASSCDSSQVARGPMARRPKFAARVKPGGRTRPASMSVFMLGR
jgi:poly-gamma-glutamate synthesis protein (capsule biosynthesis protein)